MSKRTKEVHVPIGNLPVNANQGVNQDIHLHFIRINCSFCCMHYFTWK